MTFRQDIRPSDVEAIAEMVESSNFFSDEEVEIAIELAEDRLEKKELSAYQFLFAEQDGDLMGYTCYGPIPATACSYDLYWIVVSRNLWGKGLGKRLMMETEKRIIEQGGRRLYAETSSRELYRSTHKFYEKCGFQEEAFLRDFYSDGDGKIIFTKVLK